MAPPSIDLDAYLARVGYAGEVRPTRAVLAALHARHAEAIAFESLDALMGMAPALDLAAVEAKLVRGRRGGWCFEHNLLFAHALRAAGFTVSTHSARVRWNVPAGVETPRSHMVLRVVSEGQAFLADVGFGGLTLTAPLALATGGEQATPHEPHRLLRDGDTYAHEARLGGEWIRLYLFDLVPATLADYEMANWYLAHHPGSQFRRGVVAARALPDRRLALRHDRYAIHFRDGTTQRREVRTPAELVAILEGDFDLDLPRDPALHAAFARLLPATR